MRMSTVCIQRPAIKMTLCSSKARNNVDIVFELFFKSCSPNHSSETNEAKPSLYLFVISS